MIDIDKIRKDTPGVEKVIHFNNAGASLSPQIVLDTAISYLREEALTGGYEIAVKYLDNIQDFYRQAARLINAKPAEIAFTEHASTAFNKALFAVPFQAGDLILTSEVEYGNNYLNFLKLKEEKGIEIKVISCDMIGNIDLRQFEKEIDERVKLIAITHIPTNSGLIQPAEAIGEIAKAHDILYLVDACQSVGQLPVDVEKIQCDFLSTTSRKYLRGPRGMGFLYARSSSLDKLQPAQLDMMGSHWEGENDYELNRTIKMFESFEKPYALMVGFAKALEYINRLGVENTWKRIQELSAYLRDQLERLEKVRVMDIGTNQCGIVSFLVEDITPESLTKSLLKKGINTSVSARFSTVLDMDKRGLAAVNRASVHYYNTKAEIDTFIKELKSLSQ